MDAKAFGVRASGHLVTTEGGHAAFMPAPLPPELTFTAELAERLSAADAALGELSGLAGGRRDPQILVAPFLRQEAVLSSRIEGTPATLVDLLFDEVAAAPDLELRENLREVRNYVAALQYGVERLAEVPLGSKLVLELHERLLRGVRDAAWTPGEFRGGQNWIGPPGSTIETAVYVPPPVPEMHAALSEWDRFLGERTGLPPLVQCALMHERFEAIHPFLEGNGRLGRLLITLFLIERGRLSHPLLYPSAYIEAHRDEYYGLLQAVRTDGAWDPWLLFFLDAVRETAERASAQARALMALREQYRWKVSGHARRLVDDLFRTPFVTVPEAQQELGVSNATARKAVLELQEWGMLEELAARRWPRAYIARPILDAIQAPLEDLRLRSEAKPKGATLKTGTDLEEPPEKPAERHMAEAMALIDEARRWGVQVRLMGGLAVRRYCTDLGFMDREYSDIDLVGLSVQNRELHELLTRLGYAENRVGDRGDRRRPAPVRQDRGAGGRRRRLPHRRRARGRPPGAPRRPRRPVHGRHAHGPRPRRARPPARRRLRHLAGRRVHRQGPDRPPQREGRARRDRPAQGRPAQAGRRRDLHLPPLRGRDVRE